MPLVRHSGSRAACICLFVASTAQAQTSPTGHIGQATPTSVVADTTPSAVQPTNTALLSTASPSEAATRIGDEQSRIRRSLSSPPVAQVAVDGRSSNINRRPLRSADSEPQRSRLTSSFNLPQGPVVTVTTSLTIVLAAFFLLVWLVRRAGPRGTAALPSDALEVLGQAPLNQRQRMQLVRLGNKLVLLAVTHDGAETLTEVSDPQEVERLLAICRPHQEGSITASFRHVLTQLGQESARRGDARRSSQPDLAAALTENLRAQG